VDDPNDVPQTPWWGYGPNWKESYKDSLVRNPDGLNYFAFIIYEPGTNLWEGFSTIPPEASWFPVWPVKSSLNAKDNKEDLANAVKQASEEYFGETTARGKRNSKKLSDNSAKKYSPLESELCRNNVSYKVTARL